MSSIISIKDLSFSYGKEQVLDNVNVQFNQGEFSIILGRNGSGKSTLFNVLAGLEQKYTGEIIIGDTERRKIKPGQQQGVRLGFLTQFHQTTFPFKVKDVILTGRASFSKFSPSEEDHQAVDDVLNQFELTHLKDKAYTSLSGGERQLVLLCRVLVQKPDVLLLDEPTNHLDLHYQVAVLECVRALVDRGTTVLCVMHDPNMAFMYGDKFYLTENKRLLDVNECEQEELHQLLEKTYKLPLAYLQNNGRPIYVPTRNK